MNGLAGDLVISEAWARETPPGKSMTAAYGRLQNSEIRHWLLQV